MPFPPSRISHILQKLTKLGLLVSDGHGRGTTYQLSNVRDGKILKDDKVTLQETLHAGEETLHANGETLQGLADMVIPKRMTRDKMIKKILAFCSEWRTAEEIAVFLHRSKRYITNEILSQMDNQLDLLYPQIRRHPNQKYRSKAVNVRRDTLCPES